MWPVTYRLILASKDDPRVEDDALVEGALGCARSGLFWLGPVTYRLILASKNDPRVEDDALVEGALGCGRSLTG